MSNNNNLQFVISLDDCGKRLDVFAAEKAVGITRTRIAALIENGSILLNGKPTSKNHKLTVGQLVEISLPEPVDCTAQPQEIPLDIMFEDDDIIVVNKPKGIVVHPAPGNANGTLVNALLAHCGKSLSGIGGVLRPGIVHRIDKLTSGLLMVAKNDAAHLALSAQVKEHSFLREYEAVVYGGFKESNGLVNAPIGRHPIDRKKMCITDKNSKNALTHYEVITEYKGFSHIKLKLETGRTHQIRVHMAHLGHPVAGDAVYGPKKVITQLNGQCLHAKKIGFTHPVKGEFIILDSPLPCYFTAFLKKLGEPFGVF
jgi:23S rRNA pseudouridine1911/1915/1917 synthase